MFGVDAHGQVCSYEDGSWNEFGGHVNQISVSAAAAEIWGVDDEGCVTRRSTAINSEWRCVEAPSQMRHVCLSGDGQLVWFTDFNGEIHTFSLACCEWKKTNGWLEELSMSADRAYIWGVDKTGRIWYRAGIDADWIHVSGSLHHIAVSGDGDHVWGINAGNSIFYRGFYSEEWSWAPGSLTDMCASHDGSVVWGLDPLGHVWTFCRDECFSGASLDSISGSH